MFRTVLILLALAAFIYAGLCLALFLAQRSFIYFPPPKSVPDSSPPLALDIDGERILVSTSTTTGSDAVIYFGGNAEDVRYSLPTLATAFPDRAIYAMNYRGYGGSAGQPSEKALIADALPIHIASERPVERLVLVTPYDSLFNIAAGRFGFFPLRWLMRDKFESWRYAPKVTAPTALIAAQHDEVIPAASTQALYKDFAPSVATLTTIPGTGHNAISENPAYIQLLRASP